MKRAWLTAALCLGIAAGGHTHSGDWYLVEFAANRPACEMPDTANGQDTVQRAHTTGQRTDPMPSTARCRETASRRSALELKDGEVIEMPATT
ncbi:MAG: hypothetical protein KDI31_19390, partial [Pseudomonadales bacterium]|nr:hypothetical protein [Pseudomonadales bacterium]